MIAWFASSEGRLVAAAALFALLWAVKSVPWVQEHLLTTRMRRRLAAGLLACAPAVGLLASGVSLREVVLTAASLFLGATGLNALLPEKQSVIAKPADEWPVDPVLTVAASSEPGCEPDDEVD